MQSCEILARRDRLLLNGPLGVRAYPRQHQDYELSRSKEEAGDDSYKEGPELMQPYDIGELQK